VLTAALAALFLAPLAPSAATPPAPTLRIESGRTSTVVATADVGAPLERAVPGQAYARAAAADGEQRWADAESLYRDAVSEWNAAARLEPTQPSRALELAIAKAERERQRSQLLAARARAAANRGPVAGFARRGEALDEARLLRGKLMAARAITGRVPPALYARTRDRLEQALRARDPSAPPAARVAGDAEIHLLLCATRAAAGEPEAARLARAHVTETERDDPANTLPLAICAAALGETRAALAALEIIALRPGPGRSDRFALRDLYISNDWDRLRGDPRFESLFPK
jgi:hypothetical protein